VVLENAGSFEVGAGMQLFPVMAKVEWMSGEVVRGKPSGLRLEEPVQEHGKRLRQEL